jgi:hypothetical protein
MASAWVEYSAIPPQDSSTYPNAACHEPTFVDLATPCGGGVSLMCSAVHDLKDSIKEAQRRGCLRIVAAGWIAGGRPRPHHTCPVLIMSNQIEIITDPRHRTPRFMVGVIIADHVYSPCSCFEQLHCMKSVDHWLSSGCRTRCVTGISTGHAQ